MTIESLRLENNELLRKIEEQEKIIESLKLLEVNVHSKSKLLAMSRHSLFTACACAFGVTRDEMFSNRRTTPIARARQVAMVFIREKEKISLEQIAAVFDKDHATVIWALKAVKSLCDTEPEFASKVNTIRVFVYGAEK